MRRKFVKLKEPAEKVIKDIRPEDVEIGGDTVEAMVDVAEELGSHRLLYCRCGASTVTLIDSSDRDAGAGDAVSLGFPASRVDMFDARNGRSVRSLKPDGVA